MSLAIVLFGATGDLSRRKVLPALDRLIELNELPDSTEITGVATRGLDLEGFFSYVNAGPNVRSHMSYISGNFNHAETYKRIGKAIEGKKDVIFYLASPPSFYNTIIELLSKEGIALRDNGEGFHRIIIEKPFGTNLATAMALNQAILSHFNERQIYRIDHYLGKEPVQNISAFRFSNGIFEPIWNRRYIEYVTITVAEDIGVENRGKYFEEAGILRDIVQNHLLQVLALIAMEPPPVFDAHSVRDEKTKVFRSIRPVDMKHVIRGQYDGYRKEENVSDESKVDTYAALKLFVENWRWAGVPFYVRTGKRMPRKKTEVAITFRQPPLRMFANLGDDLCGKPNQLIFMFQPEKSIDIRFGAKKPGPGMELMSVDMKFNLSDHISDSTLSDYERLLLDCYRGDLTLFARNDGVEECWKIIDPVLSAWESDSSDLQIYKPGTWGPDSFAIWDNECHCFMD